MREILFRGKRLDNGEWIEGGYFAWENLIGEYQPLILVKTESGFSYNQVFPETVCQFTGLTDKNGVKIFEGDMFNTFEEDGIDKMVVEFHYGCFTLAIYGISGAMMEYGWDETAGDYRVIECEPLSHAIDLDGAEVIGNIFDNPELMEGGGSDE